MTRTDPASAVPWSTGWPTVQIALRSAVGAAGVRALLQGAGVPVVAQGGTVLVVDDSWTGRTEELEALLPELAGVVALGTPGWTGLFQDWLAAGWPGGWAVLDPDVDPAGLLAGVLGAASGLVVLPPAALLGADLALDDSAEEAASGLPSATMPSATLPSADEVGLTPREGDVLGLLAEGLSNKRIARELGVSESTVKFHVQALYSKLGVQSRAGAVARGIGLGVVRV